MSYGGPRSWSPPSGGGGVRSWLARWRLSDFRATMAILVILVLVWALQLMINPAFTQLFWYAPLYSMPGSGIGFEPWRMLTATFLHSTTFLPHILLNGYALYIFGRNLEPMLGTSRFLRLYLISGFGGSVAVMLLGNPLAPTVGASGAVFGMFSAYFVILRSFGYRATQLLIVIVANFAISFMASSISWQAHVGGAVVGAVLGLIFAAGQRNFSMRRRGKLLEWTVVGVLLVLVAGFALLN